MKTRHPKVSCFLFLHISKDFVSPCITHFQRFSFFPPKNLERANKMIIFAPLIDK